MEQTPNSINHSDEDELRIGFGDIVTLRNAQIGDAEVICQAINTHRNYLSKWLPFVVHIHDVADEEDFLSSMLAEPYEKRNIVFIIEKEKEFCGLIGFINTDIINHRTEIGYWLLPEYQGKGIMTRCVRYLCEWSVRERDINRVQIRCAVGNHPSNAVPQRLGFRPEGTERDGELLSSGFYTDINVYSILKNEIISWNNMEQQSVLNEHNKTEYAPMHTAEHILNQTMIRLFGCERSKNTHIERKKSKCDYILTSAPSAEQITDIEDKVNNVIAMHLPVSAEFVTRQQIPEGVDLSKLPENASETLRIVRIGDYDTCACIGIHVKNTSEIGIFKIISYDFDNGKLRLRFKLDEK